MFQHRSTLHMGHVYNNNISRVLITIIINGLNWAVKWTHISVLPMAVQI